MVNWQSQTRPIDGILECSYTLVLTDLRGQLLVHFLSFQDNQTLVVNHSQLYFKVQYGVQKNALREALSLVFLMNM